MSTPNLYRQRPGAPWESRQNDDLQPGGQAQVVSEHFDNQSGPQPLLGVLPNGIPWPANWSLWDLGAVSPVQYADAGRKAGVLFINDDGIAGDQTVAAMLRPFPKYDAERFPVNQQWILYARVGFVGNGPILMADVGKYTWGVLLSEVDLVNGGPGPIDGPFVLAGLGLDGGATPFVLPVIEDWINHTTINVINVVETFSGMQVFVRMRINVLNAGAALVVVDISPDGNAWLCNCAAYDLPSIPLWIGLGGSNQANIITGSGFAPRLDYLNVYEGSTAIGADTINLLQSQGGQQMY